MRVLAETIIPVEELKLGMYIARLDRPWLDSPFKFQGFTLSSLTQISETQTVCDHVYVDFEKSVGLAAEIKARYGFHTSRQRPNDNSKRRVSDWDRKSQPFHTYRDETNTESEMARAREAMSRIESVVGKTLAAIRSGSRIDASAIDHATQDVVRSMTRNPDAMIWLTQLGNPDDYTARHCINTAVWAVTLGRQLGLPPRDLELLAVGAVYCDLGKAKVPKAVLDRPGPLNPDELDMARGHVTHSTAIATQSSSLDPAVLAMIAQHHEHHDGSGYPNGLSDKQIDLYARIGTIADCFDALTNHRPYRQGVAVGIAIAELYRLRKTHFQPELMEEFIHAIGLYPAGTLVELSTGFVGIVVGESRVRRLQPRVMLLQDPTGQALDHFPIVDLIKLEDSDDEKTTIVRDLPKGTTSLNPDHYLF